MVKKKISKSSRKFIRKEKARIRSQVLDIKEQEKLINKLYEPSHHNELWTSSRKIDNDAGDSKK